MEVAAFIFGIFIFSVSAFFLIAYIRGKDALHRSHNSLARQQQLNLKLLADLQARMETEERKYEERRRALLERAGGDSRRSDLERAAS